MIKFLFLVIACLHLSSECKAEEAKGKTSGCEVGSRSENGIWTAEWSVNTEKLVTFLLLVQDQQSRSLTMKTCCCLVFFQKFEIPWFVHSYWIFSCSNMEKRILRVQKFKYCSKIGHQIILTKFFRSKILQILWIFTEFDALFFEEYILEHSYANLTQPNLCVLVNMHWLIKSTRLIITE